ncbi:MAG TPA: maltose alpha-D-glucosyltransferase [Polyangiaceae bacterium]|nr:maltose alpha-D-glucosyltransferase [Polyangiaceae bacterium]
MAKPPTDPLPSDPQWYQNAIIYEIHVRAFADSNGDGVGDFNGLIDKLDYLQDLGVTAIWLLPFYPSPLRDGGYDIADYTNINPSYGTKRDFLKLMREAHRRGIRVITELVLNHTSSEHAWFQRSRRAPPGSKWRNFYVWSDTPDRYNEARIIFKDFETSNWSWDPVAKAYYWHRFYSHQPDLNFDNPEVHKAMLEVVDYWFDLGVDGLRLDAVPYLYERPGTNCENLGETHEFLKKLRAHVDARYADRMLLAEANQWPEDAAAYFGAGDECHMNFHFPLMPRMFMALQLEDSFPIVDILRQTPHIPGGCQWATFLRNHDELTLEMVTDEDRDYMYRVYAEDRTARINLGIRRRLAPLLKRRRRVELMTALLFSLPGTPVLYYGDEIGMGDNIYLGDRDGVRTPMQWSGDRNAGFSRANPQRLYLPVIIDPEYHYEAINVEAQQNNPSSLLWWHKRLIALRKQYKVFGRGSIEFLRPDNRKVLAFTRTYEGETALIIANMSRFCQYAELDLSAYEGRQPIELFGKTRFPVVGKQPYVVTLGPHHIFWFVLGSPKTARVEARAEPPALKVKAAWHELVAEGRRAELAPALFEYVSARRWFRGKSRPFKEATVADWVPLPREKADYGLALLRVEYNDASPDETYVVPLGFAYGAGAERVLSESRDAAVARVEGGPAGGLLFDAVYDQALAGLLLEQIRRRAVTPGERGQLAASVYRGFRELAAGEPDLTPRVPDVDQSNSTIVYGNQLLLKLYRVAEEGPNAELEIGRFFGERDNFAHAPPVVAALEYRGRGREPAAIAVAQRFQPNRGNAWQVTLDELDRYFERVLTSSVDLSARPPRPSGSFAERAAAAPPEPMAALLGSYPSTARLLGRRTAEMHAALASEAEDPAFAPEAFTTMYQQSVFQSAHALLVRTFEALRKQADELDADAAERARALLAREAEIDGRLRALVQPRLEGRRVRIHGDYHLGQVLSTGDDFIIVDFEGEPARHLVERRYKRSALRDVAGMVRSFQYASLSSLRKGRLRPEDAAALRPWAEAWADWAAAAFVGAYFEALKGSPIVPEDDATRARMLSFYLLEKCIYELGYELNSRPAFVPVPLLGLERLLEPEEAPSSHHGHHHAAHHAVDESPEAGPPSMRGARLTTSKPPPAGASGE